MIDNFYKNKKVLVTGHTGFKGTWLCKILVKAGAIVTGYSLEPPTQPSLFELSKIENEIYSIIGDIRDYSHLEEVFCEVQPEIVFHLAAQPLVREGYKNPRTTYETNVMGTVNLLECVRKFSCVRSVVNITTDKVYQNNEWFWGYREDDPLDGFDPYSNSKSCSELVTHSYKKAFFDEKQNVAVSTARAGNVIGGGDFAEDRIIPDCIRAMYENKVIQVRNPYSIRPYQHVLEPLSAYLLIAQRQYENSMYSGYYNVGPNEEDCITTGKLVSLFCKKWGENAKWDNKSEKDAPHEASFLKLDCSKIKTILGWKPRWNIEKSMEMTVRFTKAWVRGDILLEEMESEIAEFFESSMYDAKQ